MLITKVVLVMSVIGMAAIWFFYNQLCLIGLNFIDYIEKSTLGLDLSWQKIYGHVCDAQYTAIGLIVWTVGFFWILATLHRVQSNNSFIR